MKKYLDAINKRTSVSIKSRVNSKDNIEEINKALEIFFVHYDLMAHFNSFQFIIRELINNGKRANIKRIFFKDLNADINNRSHYEKEILNFSDSYTNNIEYLNEQLRLQKYYVLTEFINSDDSLIIRIKNNSELVECELERINKKIEIAKNFNGMDDALNNIFDTVESGGLGILMILLAIKKSGLSFENFKIYTENGCTIAEIFIDLNIISKGELSTLSKEIVDKLQSLPRFPENILTLLNMLNSPDSKLSKIAEKIKKDPTLTVDILKLSNSAAFMVSRKIKTIEDSVKIIGFKGVKNLLWGCAINKAFYKNNDSVLKDLWNHANEVAFISKQLSIKLRKRNLAEDSFICGLLHDLGKIVVRAKGEKLIEGMKNFSNKNHISIEFLENIALNTTHAKIGRLIGIKWELPKIIYETIGLHHTPEKSSKENFHFVYTVYLANFIANNKDLPTDINHININVRKYFNIKSNDDIENLKTNLYKKYSNK